MEIIDPIPLFNQGVDLLENGNWEKAEPIFAQLFEAFPGRQSVCANYLNCLVHQKKYSAALSVINTYQSVAPESGEVFCLSEAICLLELRHYPAAETRLLSLLGSNPSDTVILTLLARCLRLTNRGGAALELLRAHQPVGDVSTDFLLERAVCAHTAGRRELAKEWISGLLNGANKESSEIAYLPGLLLLQKLLLCDWEGLDREIGLLGDQILQGKRAVTPFVAQAIFDDPCKLQACARLYSETVYGDPPPIHSPCEVTRSDTRLTVGYVSGEFRDQATSILLTNVLENHDQKNFRIICFDNGWSDGSGLRRRQEAAVDSFVDISRLETEEACRVIRERRVDVLVDLNGYFGLTRHDIFARRPAPVQVNFLGFPGTIGHSCMDFLIADHEVIPQEDEKYYDEKIIRLPGCYQPNDPTRVFENTKKTAVLSGANPFIFASFNNTYKITLTVAQRWAEILKAVSNSVLWLLVDSEPCKGNLRLFFESRGVEAKRIVFVPRLGHMEHLSRCSDAHLFLDTFPYNAHTTGSDALWAGLPVLTIRGKTFPSRVGASLLRQVGLEDLICEDFQTYVEKAIHLASNLTDYQSVRSRLEAVRQQSPLFDMRAYTRNLERAYQEAWEDSRSKGRLSTVEG